MTALQMQNMPRPDPIPPNASQSETARAWSRYRALMSWMALASVLAVIAALVYLWASGTEMRAGTILATIAGVGLSVLLGTALMGLVFLSDRGGHDEAASGKDRQP
jgi:ABC-type multidrug transport system fused ATPase/permease subunit